MVVGVGVWREEIKIEIEVDMKMNNIEQMKVLNVLQDEIASIKQKIVDEETKLKAVLFYQKYRVEIIVAAVLVILHIAGRIGF